MAPGTPFLLTVFGVVAALILFFGWVIVSEKRFVDRNEKKDLEERERDAIERRLWCDIRTTDGREFVGRYRSANFVVAGKRIDFDKLRRIYTNGSGMEFTLYGGSIQYPREQVDGEITFDVGGISEPIVMHLKAIESMCRRG